MNIESHSQSIQKNKLVMGESLGVQYAYLWQELVSLHHKWDEYVELFGTKPSRIELLNKAASNFFGYLQHALWADILIHLACLTDPPKSMGKANLTLRNLPLLIQDEELKARVERLVEIAQDKIEFCRDWRNRYLAHRDLSLAIEDETARPLQAASRENVKEALSTMDDILNSVSIHYLDSETAFDQVSSLHGAVSLLHVINNGLSFKESQKERMQRREYLEDDFKVKDI